MKINPFKFKYKVKKNETCFSYLPKLVEEINAAAQEFLNQFDFVPSDKIAEDIDRRAWEEFRANGEDFEKTPEWAGHVVDAGVPYTPYFASRNGSLWHSLGLSVISRDAHLRCFWENIKNKTEFILPFPVVVPKNIEEMA